MHGEKRTRKNKKVKGQGRNNRKNYDERMNVNTKWKQQIKNIHTGLSRNPALTHLSSRAKSLISFINLENSRTSKKKKNIKNDVSLVVDRMPTYCAVFVHAPGCKERVRLEVPAWEISEGERQVNYGQAPNARKDESFKEAGGPSHRLGGTGLCSRKKFREDISKACGRAAAEEIMVGDGDGERDGGEGERSDMVAGEIKATCYIEWKLCEEILRKWRVRVNTTVGL